MTDIPVDRGGWSEQWQQIGRRTRNRRDRVDFLHSANSSRSLSRLLPVEIRVADDRIAFVSDVARILRG
jgi:hypothetical protein